LSLSNCGSKVLLVVSKGLDMVTTIHRMSLFLCLLFGSLLAQEEGVADSAATVPFQQWLAINVGGTSNGTAAAGLSFMTGWEHQILLSAQSGLLSNGSVSAGSLDLAYGQNMGNGNWRGHWFAGISRVTIGRFYLLGRREILYRGFGIALHSFYWYRWQEFGIGIHAYANLNSYRSFVGLDLSLRIGTLY
jgi:hypothetical protein